MQRNATGIAGLLKSSLLAFFMISPAVLFAQDDLLKLADAGDSTVTHDRVFATFKSVKVINAQSVELAKQGTLDFYITHRFGNMGVAGNGGPHTLWGFDNSQDIRFWFDYGLTKDLSIGVGRSKMNELLDGNVKWRMLAQTEDNHMPVSVVLFAATGFTPMRKQALYTGLDSADFTPKAAHRFNYVSQLIIARKFNWRFSLELLPTYVHRNFVVARTNPNDPNAVDENGFPALGGGFRFKFTKRFSFIADYFYVMSDYRRNNPGYFDPLGIGVELETGGHVFHIDLTNAPGATENNFLPNTQDSWLKGGYKLGFTISRAFGMRRN